MIKINFIKESLSSEDLRQAYEFISNKLIAHEEGQQPGVPTQKDKVAQNFLLGLLEEIKKRYCEEIYGN